MLSLKRAGEEGSATPPSDPSCPVPNTKGLPHLQGRETIAGFEDPSSRAIIPPLGQRPAVDRLPSGAERLKVRKSAVMSSWDHGRRHPNLPESLILLGAFLHAACPCRGSGQRRRILDLSASERRSCGPPSGDTPGCIRRTGRQRREASITACSLTCCHPSNATPICETRPTSLEGSPLL